MTSFVNTVFKIDRALARVETWLIVFVVALMLLMTTAQVILKLVGMPIIQLEEGARFLVIWVGFAGGAVAAYQARHINIDVVTRFMKGWPRRVCLSTVWVIGVVIAVVLLRTAISYVFTAEQSLFNEHDIAISIGQPGSAINIPGWLAAAIMPLGLTFITLHLFFGAIYAAFGVTGPGHTPQDRKPASDGDGTAFSEDTESKISAVPDDAADVDGGAA